MSSAGERQPWELEGEGADPPAYPTNQPIEEEQRGEVAAHEDAEEPSGEGEGEEETGPMDDEEPPPERTHEDEGAVGAGSQYAAEDARDEEHAEPKGPAGAT